MCTRISGGMDDLGLGDRGLLASLRGGRGRAGLWEPLPPRFRARFEHIQVDGDILSYHGNSDDVGCYIAAQPLGKDNSYFEVCIMDGGVRGNISVGLVPRRYRLDLPPGLLPGSVAFHAEHGELYRGQAVGQQFGPRCEAGDRIGCGIRTTTVDGRGVAYGVAHIFFTRNGTELGSLSVPVPEGGLFPAVGLGSAGEEVMLELTASWPGEEDDSMLVDSLEDEWGRLHDVRIAGPLLEYVGRGRSIMDVGLAQARHPLNTTGHYFEVEIIDPGEKCYIAIGVARKDYPKHRHPGWNRGSIAYHADDGKIFHGSGIGDAFGPRCSKGDVMGCGITFPRDYQLDSEGDSDGTPEWNVSPVDPEPEEAVDIWQPRLPRDNMTFGSDTDEEDDEEEDEEERDGRDRRVEWQQDDKEDGDDGEGDQDPEPPGIKVMVFFTRNGKVVGRRDARVPPGGFFPTVGMLSCHEKVRVDLRPLSG
ncbi:SPRY domain-containing protein 3 isoform X1 [Petromyzon marinus]|uniref:SPRY domain-containing protein 3 isoform X1 n=2 Tax=Petromyzon marinus TaxID=7757 RepID=A0AAJ7SKK7_PETMA|nr:SPRY domain-containing protein 3 isoform X1 [Petromyzon marinus]XP_032801016.1 SPRY domain-containing protein 3 isoform X1 [Petromyzon marinus]